MSPTITNTAAQALTCDLSFLWYVLLGGTMFGLMVGVAAVYMFTHDSGANEDVTGTISTAGAIGFVLAVLFGISFFVVYVASPEKLRTCNAGVAENDRTGGVVSFPIEGEATSTTDETGQPTHRDDDLFKDIVEQIEKDRDQFDLDGGDDDGDVATSTVPVDTTNPEIFLLGANPHTVQTALFGFGTKYIDVGAIATDDVDGDISNKIKVQGLPIITTNPGTYNIYYEVSDAAGNTARVTRQVIVMEPVAPSMDDDESEPVVYKDRIPPSIELIGEQRVSVLQFESYTDQWYRAFDNIDGDLLTQVKFTGIPVDTSVPGTHVITFSVSDSSGNEASVQRFVEVVEVIDPSGLDDGMYIQACIGREVLPVCQSADIDGDGDIEVDDFTHAAAFARQLDVNRNAVIELEDSGTIRACTFKYLSGSTFACAVSSTPSLTFSRTYMEAFTQKAFQTSLASGVEFGIDLSRLQSNLSGSDVDRVAYASAAQHDFNSDGVLDLSNTTDTYTNLDSEIMNSCVDKPATGSCAKADVNGDGMVTFEDNDFFYTWIYTVGLPDSYTIAWYEDRFFSYAAYPDKLIVTHCAELEADEGTCQYVDLNHDGVSNSADLQWFNDTLELLDVNGDGTVTGFTIELSF